MNKWSQLFRSVAIDECLAMMGMMIAAINVADPGVRKLEPWNDLAELEEEAHPPVAMIAIGIVRILDEHRGTTLRGSGIAPDDLLGVEDQKDGD